MYIYIYVYMYMYVHTVYDYVVVYIISKKRFLQWAFLQEDVKDIATGSSQRPRHKIFAVEDQGQIKGIPRNNNELSSFLMLVVWNGPLVSSQLVITCYTML